MMKKTEEPPQEAEVNTGYDSICVVDFEATCEEDNPSVFNINTHTNCQLVSHRFIEILVV